MADFNWIPDRGIDRAREAHVDAIQFGDGYEQRSAPGLNSISETLTLNFTLRPRAEIEAIDAFLESRRGVTGFTYAIGSGPERKYTCRNWSSQIEHDGDCSLHAQFKRDYSL